MSKRKKAVLIMGILKQLFLLFTLAFIVFAGLYDPKGDKFSALLENIGAFKLLDSIYGIIAIYAGFFLIQGVVAASFVTYYVLNKYFQTTYSIAAKIFMFIWWLWFLPPVGLVVTVFLFITPFVLAVLLETTFPIMPGLIYVLFMDKAPKEKYTYVE